MFRMTRVSIAAILFLALWAHASGAEINLFAGPNAGTTAAIVTEIESATSSILCWSYAFQSAKIADALSAAEARGVEVKIVIDRAQAKNRTSRSRQLATTCTACLTPRLRGIQHCKTMLIDGRTIVTGSFNWTDRAEWANAEHLLIFDDPKLAAQLAEHWQTLAANSQPVLQILPPTPKKTTRQRRHHFTPPPQFSRRVRPW